MPDTKSNQSESQSLFAQKDILHDIETVQARWEREHRRRRAQMIKLFIVGGFFLTLAIGTVIYRIHLINQIRISMEEEEAKKFLPIGYRNAKIHVISYAGDTYESVENILREAVDNMPSEFYIEFKSLEGVDGEEVEKALGKFRPGIVINNQYQFTLKDDEGNDKEVKFVDDPGYSFRIKDIGIILNRVHKELYGDRYLRPINSLFDNRIQAVPIEGSEDDMSDDEQTITEKHDHDDDKEEENPEGVVPRTPLSPDELKIPKFDAKTKK